MNTLRITEPGFTRMRMSVGRMERRIDGVGGEGGGGKGGGGKGGGGKGGGGKGGGGRTREKSTASCNS